MKRAVAALLAAACVGGAMAAAVPVVSAQAAPTHEELRRRALRGITATVEGRVYLERPRPDVPDEPLVGASVVMLPSSPAVLASLADIKQRSRESMQGFRDAAPAVRALIEAYETDAWQAGYPDVVPRTGTDARGTFRTDVPAGRWIVLVTRRVFMTVDKTAGDAPRRSATALDPLARYAASQYQHFLPTTRMTGFDAVSFWLRELEAEPGQRLELELHDRGVWLSGVEEETTVPRRLKFEGGLRRQ